MANNIHDDEHIAELLKQDAKNAKKKYELVGIDAFNPKRCVSSTYISRSSGRSTTSLLHAVALY